MFLDGVYANISKIVIILRYLAVIYYVAALVGIKIKLRFYQYDFKNGLLFYCLKPMDINGNDLYAIKI